MHLHSHDVCSFYHLYGTTLEHERCTGLACFVARRKGSQPWAAPEGDAHRRYCLGKCYLGPATASSPDAGSRIELHTRQSIVLTRLANGGAATLDRYIAAGGYQAIRKALSLSSEEIVAQVEASQLRGRGGAGFPTGRKWRAVRSQAAGKKLVVANGDEGDPGAYIDRFLLEGDPHSIIEAMAIAGYAVGAAQGYLYVRKEYPAAASRFQQARDEARARGFLGTNLLGSGFSFDIDLSVGEGSYVCGEETCLLNSLEGRRPHTRVRPPYPTESGFMGRPTLIANVETLANIPWIVLHGGSAYQSLGYARSRGTKAISLNSLFRKPGLYEVEFGISLRQIVEEIGGGLAGGSLRGVIIGGPLAGVVPPHLLDTAFAFEELSAIGSIVGHGGIVAFDEGTSIAELARHVFEFGAFESCGKCTPCRLGARRVLGLLLGNPANSKRELPEIVEALRLTSLCGLGTGLAAFASSILRYYDQELAACLVS
jgi:NADH:ubiquinone oxidoreductase subunit F (NADH-binding)